MLMNQRNAKWIVGGILAAFLFGGLLQKFARATPGSGIVTTILTCLTTSMP